MPLPSSVVVKWGKEAISINIDPDDSVSGLKRKIEVETGVRSVRQKLMGLKSSKGGLPKDEDSLDSLLFKPGQTIMMIGKLEADIAQGNAAADQATAACSVQDDFDVEEGDLAELHIKDRPENLEKLQRRVASAKIKELNPPRPGKKCLVLDIDYTIFDLGSAAERPEELARPHLHELLEAVYPHYDLVIWSATSMKWIEVKMRELGVSTHSAYKVSLFLDHQSMVTVRDDKHGVFDCKPLPLLWQRYECYTSQNTVMLDDLRRNYVMNPQNGLVIRPYRHAARNRSSDQELAGLKEYLLKLASLPDLSGLRHSRWEHYK